MANPMDFYYTNGRNVQILISVLKANNIRKVIVSPGTTNIEFVASIQNDDSFEMYSCVDERSAAYMACGLAAESGEPVVLTCTEATASRNYFPGLTEAYHRKLPVLAVTCLHDCNAIGHLEPQVIDRSVSPNDVFKLKVELTNHDEWDSVVKINNAVLELTRHGGGPVHINLPWLNNDFELQTKEFPPARVIKRYNFSDTLPPLPNGRIGVFVGSHNEWTKAQADALDRFCETTGAVVFCDLTSKYYGKYRVKTQLLAMQPKDYDIFSSFALVIHIGEETGDLYTQGKLKACAKEVWRVSPDGELRDSFHKLRNVFEMDEEFFFNHYAKGGNYDNTIVAQYKKDYDELVASVPEIPFSSVYAASIMSKAIPENSVLHLGVSDTIRVWSMFPLSENVRTSCNAGCRGIDGCVSALVGASLVNRDKLYFGVTGDLTFFYDMNVLGNREIGNNVRIMIINNNGGNIFRHKNAPAERRMGMDNANKFVAAAGHFGRKSRSLLKHYTEDLGFEYLSADNKEDFLKAYKRFTEPQLTDKPMFFEVFTTAEDDNEAFHIMQTLATDSKHRAKSAIKSILGKQGTQIVKKIKK